MRLLFVALLPLLAGCDAWFSVVPKEPPANEKVVIGGHPNQSPFFGKIERLIDGQTGDFLLATCGCGEWRALFQMTDGSQWQLPVNFYTQTGMADLNSDAKVYGREEDRALMGFIQSLDGHLTADTERSMLNYRVDAYRGPTHSDDATTCVRCHVGSNAVFPQPPTHPAFQLDPPNCLSCHTVVIE